MCGLPAAGCAQQFESQLKFQLFDFEAGGSPSQRHFELGAASVNGCQAIEAGRSSSSEPRQLLERFHGTSLVHVEADQVGRY